MVTFVVQCGILVVYLPSLSQSAKTELAVLKHVAEGCSCAIVVCAADKGMPCIGLHVMLMCRLTCQ